VGDNFIRSLVGLPRKLAPSCPSLIVAAEKQLESVANEKSQESDFLIDQVFILRERMMFAQLSDCGLAAPVVRIIPACGRGFLNLGIFLVGQAKGNIAALPCFLSFRHFRFLRIRKAANTIAYNVDAISKSVCFCK